MAALKAVVKWLQCFSKELPVTYCYYSVIILWVVCILRYSLHWFTNVLWFNSLFSVSVKNVILQTEMPTILESGPTSPKEIWDIFQCSNELFDDEYICELMTFTEDVHILLKGKCV